MTSITCGLAGNIILVSVSLAAVILRRNHLDYRDASLHQKDARASLDHLDQIGETLASFAHVDADFIAVCGDFRHQSSQSSSSSP
jgi:hypothetical protein